jgi:NADH:ubiquinone oxidoreductase subunit 6 (subunit J)
MARETTGRNETPEERADRNLSELLQELRVALPGVQVLFAFLLTVPFSQNFSKLNEGQQKLYYGVLIATTLATALLIAPTAHHRLLFRQGDKEHLVTISNRYAIIGLGVLGTAIGGALFLIGDYLYGTATTVIVTGAIGSVFVTVWYVLPLYRRSQLRRSERGEGT